jgi:hypothetical protein
MPINTACPMCGHKWQAPDNAQGRQVRCPECYQVYGMAGTPDPKAAPQRTGASHTGASHAGAPKRAATNGSYAGAPMVRPSPSSQGGAARRPATAGSQAGNQAVRRPADTPAPFTAPGSVSPAPVPAPRPAAAPAPRSSGGGSSVLGIFVVLFLLLGMGGAGIVGLIYLKKAVEPADSAVAKANDGPVAKADEPQPPTEAEKKPAAADNKPTTPDKKPTAPDKKAAAPETKTKTAPVEPAKPTAQKPVSREGYLVNMLQGPAVLGDGELTVTAAGIGSLQANGVNPKEKYFIVRLALRNTSKTNNIDFYGWGPPDPINEKTPPQLLDSMGNSIKPVVFPVGVTIEGQTSAQTIHPGEQATDVVVFAVPRNDALYLKLILGGPEKREGTFRILIPAAKFVAAAPEPKPAPPVVKAPDPKPPMPAPPVVVVPPEVAALIKGLQSPKPEDRLAAIGKLGDMKADAAPAVAELVKHLDDANEQFRLATVQALGKIGPKAAPAVPDLVRRLSAEGAAPVRAETARTLGLIGPAAAAATDALKVALQDADATVVQEVRMAIKLIEGNN